MAKGDPRILSEKFKNAFLTGGLLAPILEYVKADWTLDFQIRAEAVIIYYHGGKILQIKPSSKKMKFFNFTNEKKYGWKDDPRFIVLTPKVGVASEVQKWCEMFPVFMSYMNQFMTPRFIKKQKIGKETRERIVQQQVVVENTYWQTASESDYFIVDIEYDSGKSGGRFDMLAVKWKSSGSARRRTQDIEYALIELKYGKSAVSTGTKNSPGLKKHINDVEVFLSRPENRNKLEKEIFNLFNQKHDLGLISGIKKHKRIKSLSEKKPEFIIALANWHPQSKILQNELEDMPTMKYADLKFAVSTFMGYGLFTESLYSKDEFVDRFKNQIYVGD
jgi:hypothetical protein